MPDIDDQFIDVDFTKDPNYVFGDLGDFCFGSYDDYERAVPSLSESEINACIERMEADKTGGEWLVPEVKDQKREGACTSDAIAHACQSKQAEQFGVDNVILVSAISLYKRIARSASSGSAPSDGIRELESRGILPLDNAANRTRFGSAVMPNTGFNTPFPADWEDTAKQFVLREWYAVRTVEGLMTALCNRDPVVVGREGHAICYVTPKIVSGRWAVAYVNSWGKWGMSMGAHEYGFGVDTLSQVQKSAKYAFVLRSVRTPQVAT